MSLTRQPRVFRSMHRRCASAISANKDGAARRRLPLPLAILKRDVLKANSRWMYRFTAENGLVIAPHGKTTMAPQLFDQQIADGAWAITVATAKQLAVCRQFGVKRVILANQPIGAQSIDACFEALRADRDFELYCLADSTAGVALLAEGAKRHPPTRGNPLRVFVEIGFIGGRAGARSRHRCACRGPFHRRDARAHGCRVRMFRRLAAGCGLGGRPDRGSRRNSRTCERGRPASARRANDPDRRRLRVLRPGRRKIAGGSFDRPLLKILRSGCYLTHDDIGYAAAFRRITTETTLRLPEGGLEPALEVWAYVQSRPESGRTILTMGKRDVSYNSSLPVPVRWYRPNGTMERPEQMPRGHVVIALNDQHCHLGTPGESPLRVGDMVGFGIGHPCTTFDKWALLMMVDEDYRVVDGVKTIFEGGRG